MANLYPDAGENAPPGVQYEIDRFREMGNRERRKRPLLYHLLGSGTPDYKMSKRDSNYTDKSPGAQKCGNCRFAYKKVKTGEYICSQISGKIDPGGWCRLWKA